MTETAPAAEPEFAPETPPESTPSPFALPARLDTDAAEQLRGDLLTRRGQDLELDASAVTRLGGLCATVLASAAQSWAADGHRFAILGPSGAFEAARERLGLTPEQLTSGGAT